MHRLSGVFGERLDLTHDFLRGNLGKAEVNVLAENLEAIVIDLPLKLEILLILLKVMEP